MSRSPWASTKGCTPVSAIRSGTDQRAELGERTCLGTLLDAASSMTRLMWVVAVSLTVSALGSSPALAGTGPSLHSQQPASKAHNSQTHTHQAAVSHPVAAVVLAPGSGYDSPGGSRVVRSLQAQLARAGFAPGPVDGRYGPRTERAVRGFQDSRGLQVDGIAGRLTLAALTAPTPALYPGAGYQSGGSEPVRELQRQLARAGNAPGPIDGLYGPRTERAVMHFQATHRLSFDGGADPLTFTDGREQARAQAQADKITSRARPQADPQTSRSELAAQRTPAPGPPSPPRTDQPSSAPSIPWLVLLPALGVGLVLLVLGYTNRRRRKAPAAPPARQDNPDAPAALGRQASAAFPLEPEDGSITEPEARAPMDGDADRVFTRAVQLEERKDRSGAEAAYRHAEELGHAAAASNLGVLLEGRGDLAGAEWAYRRANERGDANGAFNLAVLLEEREDLVGAEAAYRHADELGHAAAASNLGVLLEGRGDLAGAAGAYRRADERGDANGAFNLAVVLEEREDLVGAEAAYRRAHQRGQGDVSNTARAALLEVRTRDNRPNGRNGGRSHVE